jgi:hypothetical protein
MPLQAKKSSLAKFHRHPPGPVSRVSSLPVGVPDDEAGVGFPAVQGGGKRRADGIDDDSTQATASSRVWRGQWHKLVRCLHRLRDERAAAAVGGGDETRGHVVAEEGNFRDVGSLLDRQDAAGVAAVIRVSQRRVDAEWDSRKVDTLLRAEVRHLPGEDRGLSSHNLPVEPAKVTWPESETLTSSTVPAAIVAGALPGFCSTTGGSVISK